MVRFLKRLAVWLFLIFVLLLSGLLLFRSKYRNTLRQLAETQVKNSSSDLTNDSLTELLQGNDVQYDRIVYFEKDLNGKITAMKTNIMEVNRLKTRILELVNGRILALDTTDLGIPIGSLLFPEVFYPHPYSVHSKLRRLLPQRISAGGHQPDPPQAPDGCNGGCEHSGAGADGKLFREQRGCGGRNRHRGGCTGYIF